MLLGQIQQCTDPVSPHPRGAIGQVHLNREQVGQARALDARPFRKAQLHPALIGLGGKTLHNAPRRRLIDDDPSPAPSATSPSSVSMTVLPIPRAPVTRVSRSGAPEPSSIDSENRSVAHWRPRSSGGMAPAVGGPAPSAGAHKPCGRAHRHQTYSHTNSNSVSLTVCLTVLVMVCASDRQVLHLLQLLALGLGRPEEDEDERRQGARGVEAVGEGEADAGEGREGGEDEEIGHSLGRRGHGQRPGADPIGEHLAEQHPHQRPRVAPKATTNRLADTSATGDQGRST